MSKSVCARNFVLVYEEKKTNSIVYKLQKRHVNESMEICKILNGIGSSDRVFDPIIFAQPTRRRIVVTKPTANFFFFLFLVTIGDFAFGLFLLQLSTTDRVSDVPERYSHSLLNYKAEKARSR